jgi:hypothetical protein
MMYFLNSLPYLETLYDEFERCMGGRHLTHDDIPDNLGYQPRYAPSMAQAIIAQERERFSRPDGAWNYLFDQSGELYGEGQAMHNPSFHGMILTNDPDNPGVLRWVSEQPQNPVVVQTESLPVNEDNGLDPVLGWM